MIRISARGWCVENGVVEWLQVILMAIAGVLAARQGLAAKRRGEPFALEVAIVGGDDHDLHRRDRSRSRAVRREDHPHAVLRESPVTRSAGVCWRCSSWWARRRPWASGSSLHIRELWRASLRGLFEPWGQTATFGIALFMFVQVFERRHRPSAVAAAGLLRRGPRARGGDLHLRRTCRPATRYHESDVGPTLDRDPRPGSGAVGLPGGVPGQRRLPGEAKASGTGRGSACP